MYANPSVFTFQSYIIRGECTLYPDTSKSSLLLKYNSISKLLAYDNNVKILETIQLMLPWIYHSSHQILYQIWLLAVPCYQVIWVK